MLWWARAYDSRALILEHARVYAMSIIFEALVLRFARDALRWKRSLKKIKIPVGRTTLSSLDSTFGMI